MLVGSSIFEADPHTLHPLKGPPNDLRILFDALTHEQVGLFEQDNVQVLLDKSQREITGELETFFGNAGINDQLLFYYSGHGLLDIRNNLYLCARDTTSDRLISTGIPDSQISNMLLVSASSRIVIILDCCHSGRFKSSPGIPANLTGEGRFIIASSRAGENAADALEKDEPSAFTRHLVNALLSAEVDSNNDRLVSLNEVYKFLYPRLKEETKQTPQMKFDDAVGDIVIGKTIKAISNDQPPNGRPILAVSDTQIFMDDVDPDEKLPEEMIYVYNKGSGNLEWEWCCEDDWIAVERFHDTLKLRLSPRPGINRGRLYISGKDSAGSKRIQIKVNVNEKANPPRLQLSEERIDFGKITQGCEKPVATLRLYNAGGGELNPRVTSTYNFFTTELAGDLVTVKLNNSETGPRNGEIKINTDGGDKTVPVTALVEKGPILLAEPDRIDFGTIREDDSAPRRINISNGGSGKLEWDFEKRGTWFRVYRRGSALEVKVDCKPGNYHGAIILKSKGGDKTVEIKATVKHKEPPPPPPIKYPEIAGMWRNDMGGFIINGTGPQYTYMETNNMGVVVGEGTLTANGNQLVVQGYNILAGPVSGTLAVSPNMLNGTLIAAGVAIPASFWH